MNEPLTLVLAGMAGCLLGTLFFGGLWWTVRKGVASQRPALWFGVSLLVRTVSVLAGFYFVAGGHWARLAACLLGFVAARFIVTLRLRSGQALRLRSGQALRLRSGQALRLRSGQALRLRSGQALRLRSGQALRLRSAQALRLRSGQAGLTQPSIEPYDAHTGETRHAP
jgi:F1F0 ATPase subunit 2